MKVTEMASAKKEDIVPQASRYAEAGASLRCSSTGDR
jgi:hypothetical protein